MIYAYLRHLSGKRNIAQQQNSILSFSLGHGMEIGKEVIEYSAKNRPIEERKEFENFVHGLKSGDAIIVDEVWMLSEKVDEIIKIIGCMLDRGITLYGASSAAVIDKKSAVGDIFPLLNRIREAQHNKPKQIGRPKGSRSVSKFDKLHTRILKLLKEGKNVSVIARELNVSRSSLKDYIESRGIKEVIDEVSDGISAQAAQDKQDDKILLCPFGQKKNNIKGEEHGSSRRK